VRSPLPTHFRGPPRHAQRPGTIARASLVALLLLAPAARALEITAQPPRERSGYLWVDVRLADLFEPRVEGSLARGMPATLTLHAELWRRRIGWFDGLEDVFDAELRLRYDFHTSTYRLERNGAPPLVVPGLDSVRAVLLRPLPLPVGRIGPLRADRRYYVVVSATLKPLSVEDAAEVEGWLSGEVGGGGGRSEPFGLLIGLPRSLFDTARNFAGFGDEHARATTDDFELRDLFSGR
jgi:hypothetical protein